MTFTKATLTVAVACLFLALPSTVVAHAELVASSPADGEELSTPPEEIRLVFSERPQPGAVSVRLFDRRGTELELGEPEIDPQLGTTVSVAISQELRPGPYTVVWSVVSEEDEHPVSREFVFGIEEAPGRPAITAAELEGLAGGNAGLLARFLSLLGLLVMVGAAVQARWFSLSPTRMAHLAGAGAATIAAGLLLNALATASARVARAGPLDWIDAPLVLGLLLAGVALVAGILAPGQDRRGARRLWLLVLVAAFGLAWILAARSHAAGVGILLWVGVVWQSIDLAISRPELYPIFPHLFELARQLNVLVASIHTLAVSAWIGGLVGAGIAGLGREEIAGWHPRFSRFALRAFLVVAVTGLYQAVLYLSSPQAVVDSDYGVMLLGKHVFVVGVIGLAAVNRFVIAPALRSGTGGGLRRRAVAVVRTEAAVGVIVVGAAALLAGTSPARPPTDVFLAPEVVAELSGRHQTVAGDREGWELVIARQSSTRHGFLVRGPAPLAENAFLLLENPDGDERELRLEQSAEGAHGEGLVLSRDGVWTASLDLSASDVRFTFDVRAGHVLPHNAQSRTLWEQAISESERRMRSARMIDVLTDGLSLMLFAHHELGAPDTERLEILGAREMVSIGRQRFTRTPGSGWETDELGRPFRWPDYTFLQAVMGVTNVGEATHAGHPVTVLAGYDPESTVAYEIWVDRDANLIQRVVMGVPGHYMINAYYDVNTPLSIQPPV